MRRTNSFSDFIPTKLSWRTQPEYQNSVWTIFQYLLIEKIIGNVEIMSKMCAVFLIQFHLQPSKWPAPFRILICLGSFALEKQSMATCVGVRTSFSAMVMSNGTGEIRSTCSRAIYISGNTLLFFSSYTSIQAHVSTRFVGCEMFHTFIHNVRICLASPQ